jgi:hypothetical protein
MTLTIESVRRGSARLTEGGVMDRNRRAFVTSFVCVVVLGLLPVILVTVLSVPLTVGHHPGESHGGTSGASIDT